MWSNTVVANSPSFKGRNGLVRYGLGSWEVSGVGTMRAGVPFSVNGGSGSNNSLSQQNSDRADVVPGQHLQVKQGGKSQWLNHYFNTAAFVPNAAGTFGTSGRNILRTPRQSNLDMMIAKNFPFRDEYRIQLRWEMFNATNTPVYAAPTADPSSTSNGQIVSTAGSPRIMQFGAKFNF